MVDAAGAIYVIGGDGGNSNGTFTGFQDVWASTDGGARAGRGRGWSGGYSVGTHESTTGMLQGYYGGVTWGTRGLPRECLRGTDGVMGYSRGTLRAFPWQGGDVRYY